MILPLLLLTVSDKIPALPAIIDEKSFQAFGYEWKADTHFNGNHAYQNTGITATKTSIKFDISKTSWGTFDGRRIKQATRVYLKPLGFGKYVTEYRGNFASFDPSLVGGCWLRLEIPDRKGLVEEITAWESSAWGDENNPFQHYITFRGDGDKVLSQGKFAARKFVRYRVTVEYGPKESSSLVEGIYSDGRTMNVANSHFPGTYSDQMVLKACLFYAGDKPTYNAVRDQGERTMEMTSFKFEPRMTK